MESKLLRFECFLCKWLLAGYFAQGTVWLGAVMSGNLPQGIVLFSTFFEFALYLGVAKHSLDLMREFRS